jgi:hypothetical protein
VCGRDCVLAQVVISAFAAEDECRRIAVVVRMNPATDESKRALMPEL